MSQRDTAPCADLTIHALLDAHPDAGAVLLRHGMACVGCVMARFETLAEAAREYGLEAGALLAELRSVASDSPTSSDS